MVRFQKYYSMILLLAILLLMLTTEIVFSDSNIQGVPGYTTVEKQAGTNIYHIRSNKIINKGEAVLNRYTSFYLDTGNTANIYLGTSDGVAQAAINVVKNPLNAMTTLNGILKLVAGQNALDPVGGNLIFVDPQGIMVGPNGSINAGSIILSSSAQTYVSQNSGSGVVDLNDPGQDHVLINNVIDINGIYRFNSISGPVRIDGFLDTLHGFVAAGVSPGVSIFANNLNFSHSGRIFTGDNSHVNLITGREVNYDASSGGVDPQSTLLSGGRIDIAGNISSPQGNVLASVSTEDIAQNIINLTGFIDAYSMAPGATGGVVVLDASNYTPGPGTPGVSINNGRIETSGDVLIQTPNNVNINNSNTLISASGDLTIQGGSGMYLNGSYYSDNGNIIINNTGTNNLLIDSSLYATSGNIDINSNGYTISGFSQMLDAPPPVSVLQAYGNINITANPFNSYARINSQTGDVTINSGCAAEFYEPGSVFAYNNINVTGNSVIVNQPFNAMNGDLILQSNSGDLLLGSNGMLSSLHGTIYIERGNTTGPFNTEFYGIISAENTSPGLIFRNDNPHNTNYDLINIEGTTFGPYGGVYSNTGTVIVNNQHAQGLYIDRFQVLLGNDQPNPPKPPTPPTPPRKPKNPNRPADQGEENQLYDFTQSYQTTALNNTYSNLYPNGFSLDVTPSSTYQLAYNYGLPSSSAPVIYDQDNILAGQGESPSGGHGTGQSNGINSQYAYEWYKLYAEESGTNWVKEFYPTPEEIAFAQTHSREDASYYLTINDIMTTTYFPEPITREEAWDRQTKAWMEWYDAEHDLLDANEALVKAEYALKEAANDLEKAKLEYDEKMKDREEIKDKYEQIKKEHEQKAAARNKAFDDFEKGKMTYEEYQKFEDESDIASDNFAKAMDIYYDTDGYEAQAWEEYYKVKESFESAKLTVRYAENNVSYTKSRITNAKMRHEEAKKTYERAVEASNAVNSHQKTTVDSGGGVTIGGQVMDLESLKATRDSLRTSSGTGTQSLNPRSALGARGRTPDLTPDGGISTEFIELQEVQDGPIEIQYSEY
jgi:filamentous hemagglutinin family protein